MTDRELMNEASRVMKLAEIEIKTLRKLITQLIEERDDLELTVVQLLDKQKRILITTTN